MISILITTLNSEKHIAKALKSVVEQDYKDLEIIVVDGGSNDRTQEIVKSFIKKDKRVKLFSSTSNRGISIAINNGIKVSQGEIIGYLASDDWYEKNILSAVIRFFKNNPQVLWIYGDSYNVYEKEDKIDKLNAPNEFNYQLLLKRCYIGLENTFIKKELFGKVGLFNPKILYSPDYEFWLRVGRNYKPKKIPKPISYDLVHTGAVSQRHAFKQNWESFWLAWKYSKGIKVKLMSLRWLRSIVGIIIRKIKLYRFYHLLKSKLHADDCSNHRTNQFMKGQFLRLHLGCGEQYLEGYINIDFPPSRHTVISPKADVYKDIRDLEYPEESVDEVRSHHLFEHFSKVEAIDLLLKWRKWLKTDGVLRIETPDFTKSISLFRIGNFSERMQLARHIFGSQEAKWAYHKDYWDKQKFKFFLSKLGFYQLKFKKSPGFLKTFIPYILRRLSFLKLILGPKFYKEISYLRLPNIEVQAKKKKGNINREKIKEDLLKLSLVGYEAEEGKLLRTWLKQ
ncbi:MAG: glycosyltransferase [Candidatus Nealsonbacteria bacterium]